MAPGNLARRGKSRGRVLAEDAPYAAIKGRAPRLTARQFASPRRLVDGATHHGPAVHLTNGHADVRSAHMCLYSTLVPFAGFNHLRVIHPRQPVALYKSEAQCAVRRHKIRREGGNCSCDCATRQRAAPSARPAQPRRTPIRCPAPPNGSRSGSTTSPLPQRGQHRVPVRADNCIRAGQQPSAWVLHRSA